MNKPHLPSILPACWLIVAFPCAVTASDVQALSIMCKSEATQVTLSHPDARQQILVTSADTDGRLRDVTRDVEYLAEPRGIVAIDSSGFVRPLANGRAVTARLRTARRLGVLDQGITRATHLAGSA